MEFSDFCIYSKICVEWPLKNRQNKDLKDQLKRYEKVFSLILQIIAVIVRKRLLKTASKNA